MIVAIRKRLLDTAGVTALVSARIFINTIQQGAQMPCILLDVDDSDPRDAKEVMGKVIFWDMTVHCTAETYTSVYALRNAVYASLQNFTGNVTLTDPAATVAISQCRYISQSEDFQENQKGAHIISMRFRVAELQSGTTVQYPDDVAGDPVEIIDQDSNVIEEVEPGGQFEVIVTDTIEDLITGNTESIIEAV